MMSTVLLVDTHPVKTDSKTRAGVHNDVSNPSVAQQLEGSEVQHQPPQNEWNLANATRTAVPVEYRTKAWTILDIPTTHKRT